MANIKMKTYVPDPKKGPMHAFHKARDLARKEQSSVIISSPEWDRLELPKDLLTVSDQTTDDQLIRQSVTVGMVEVEPDSISDIKKGYRANPLPTELSDLKRSAQRNPETELYIAAVMNAIGRRP